MLSMSVSITLYKNAFFGGQHRKHKEMSTRESDVHRGESKVDFTFEG